MSGQLGELVVSIAADLARFREDMGKANRTAQDTMNRMQSDISGGIGRIERSFSSLGVTVGSALSVGALVAFGKECTQAALAAEKLNMQFKASTGNAMAAGRELAYIKNLSASLGLEIQTTATAYGKFLAATRDTSIEGNAARKVFEGVSEASTALGLSAEETGGIFLALSQMMSKGKVQAEELTGQLGERLPGALKLAANGMGMTTAELMKQMQEGKIMSAELLPKLAAELHKTYGVAAVEASKQGRAGINQFKNEIFETTSAIGSHLVPAVNSMARSMADALKTFREEPAGGWKNLLEPFMVGGRPQDNRAYLDEAWRIPRAGEALDPRVRARGRISQQSAFGPNVDPQMARAEADRRATQEEVNRQRAEKERFAAGAAEREKAAKEAEKAAEQARQEYNRGVQAYNRLVNVFIESRPDLSDTQKTLAKINDEVATLSREHPEQAKDAQRMGERIKEQLELADAIKVKNAELKQSIHLLEELNKDFDGFSKFDRIKGRDVSFGLGVNFGLDPKKPKYDLLPDYDGKPKTPSRFSLTGAPEASLFGGKTGVAEETDSMHKELLKMERSFQKELFDVKADAAQSAIGLMKSAAGENKALQMTAMVAEKALAIARIMMNTEVAASAAIAASASIPGGVAIGEAQAAAIRAMSYASIGMVAASGIMEGVQIAGRRATGGPVNAGQTYLVGERGPELLTMAADGYVTPNNALGGGSVTQHINIDARGADASVVQRIDAAMKRAKDEAKSEILASMNRGGQFALASGRVR